MADVTWPFADGDTRYATEAFDETIAFNVELNVSRSGRVTTQSLPGARFRCSIQFPETTVGYLRERRQITSFLANLRGGADRLLLWNLLTPEPLGTMRGSPTLSSTVSAGATTAALAGCIGTNLLLGGSFEFDTNADGLSDGWSEVSSGSVISVDTTRPTTQPSDGTYEQGVDANYLDPGASHVAGVERIVQLPSGPGQYTVAVSVWGEVELNALVQMEWRNSGGSIISSSTIADLPLTATSTRIGGTATAPSGTTQATVRLLTYRTTGSSIRSVRWDACAVKAGAADLSWPGGATLLRGDFVAFGGQRVMLTADATANDAGAVTISFQPPHRAGAASASAVTLIRPTTKYVLTQPFVPMPVRGSSLPGFGVDLVEE